MAALFHLKKICLGVQQRWKYVAHVQVTSYCGENQVSSAASRIIESQAGLNVLFSVWQQILHTAVLFLPALTTSALGDSAPSCYLTLLDYSFIL